MKFFPGALLALLLATLSAWASDPLPLDQAKGRPIVRIDVKNPSNVGDWELRALFLLHEGDLYDPSVVQRGLTLLAQKQGIRAVEVSGFAEGDGLALQLSVEPEPLIRSLSFEGNHLFSDKELAAKLRTAVDRPALRPLLDADAGSLRDAYVEEGFVDAAVEPVVTPRGDPLWVDVSFRVSEGSAAPVSSLDFGETGHLDTARVADVLGLREGSNASLKKLQAGVPELLKGYHKDGYIEARAPRPRFERRDGKVVLVLSLVAGSRVDVRFSEGGGDAPGFVGEAAREHYGELADGAWASKVSATLLDALHARGYRNALVDHAITESAGVRKIVFRVTRGPLVRVTHVAFQGIREESAGHLKNYLSVLQGGIFRSPPFTQEALDRDLRVLADYYRSKGFLDARVTLQALEVSTGGDASVSLAVDEGTRYRLGRLEFLCDASLTPAEALAVSELAVGQDANLASLEAARVRLLAESAKKGYADTGVTLTTAKNPSSQTLDVSFAVRAQNLVRFGKIVASGNARTDTRVLLRELTFREGDPWNAQEVLISQQKLFRLGFFQKVRIEPLDPNSTDSRRDVLLLVEEQDAGSVSFGIGYGTEEGVTASAEVAHANLWGSGRSARLRANLEGKDWSAAASFGEPWFLGTRMDLVVSLLRQIQRRPSYNLASTGFQASLDKKITERIRASLLYTLEDNRLSDVAVSADVKDINQYLLSAVGPVVAWDSRNDPFNPTEGYQHTLQAEWALESLRSEVQYARYLGSTAGFFSWGGVTLALLARGGFAENFGKSADLPANKRFYLGGRTTVRGFELDAVGPLGTDRTPLGGDTMLNFRAELRYPVWRHLGGDVFWDAGNVWNRKLAQPHYLDLREAAGGGLRYQTPVGPITLDVGYKLGRKTGEARTEWYFTIGNVF